MRGSKKGKSKNLMGFSVGGGPGKIEVVKPGGGIRFRGKAFEGKGNPRLHKRNFEPGGKVKGVGRKKQTEKI